MCEASLDHGSIVFIVWEEFDLELHLLAGLEEHREWPFLRPNLGFEGVSPSAKAAWSRR
jgi:hypothetical protein